MSGWPGKKKTVARKNRFLVPGKPVQTLGGADVLVTRPTICTSNLVSARSSHDIPSVMVHASRDSTGARCAGSSSSGFIDLANACIILGSHARANDEGAAGQ
jgi:hypothetical protein